MKKFLAVFLSSIVFFATIGVGAAFAQIDGVHYAAPYYNNSTTCNFSVVIFADDRHDGDQIYAAYYDFDQEGWAGGVWHEKGRWNSREVGYVDMAPRSRGQHLYQFVLYNDNAGSMSNIYSVKYDLTRGCRDMDVYIWPDDAYGAGSWCNDNFRTEYYSTTSDCWLKLLSH